jgi:hypothetical protein
VPHYVRFNDLKLETRSGLGAQFADQRVALLTKASLRSDAHRCRARSIARRNYREWMRIWDSAVSGIGESGGQDGLTLSAVLPDLSRGGARG